MVGGLILMGVLVNIMAIAPAMVLHGLVQLTANGYRAILNQRDIAWHLMVGFIIGGIIALSLMMVISFVPNRIFVFFALGLLPFIAYILPARLALDITRPFVSLIAGFCVVIVILMAGVGGPTLDIFFQRVPLTRHQVIATKAVAQSLGHITKIVFYGGLVAQATSAWPPFHVIGLAIIFSMGGTTLGKRVLDSMEDKQFFRLTQAVMLAVGAGFLLRALWLFFAEYNS